MMNRVHRHRAARLAAPVLALAAGLTTLTGPAVGAPDGPGAATSPALRALGDARGGPRAEAATFASDPGTQVSGPNTFPRDLAVSSSGRRAFALDEDRLAVLDVTRRPSPVVGRTGNVFGTDIAVRRGGRWAYVVNDQQLYVVDVRRQRPRLARVVSTRTPTDALDVVVAPDGRHLYVAYGSGFPTGRGNGVRVLSLRDPARPQPVARFDTGTFPQGIAVSRDGDRVVTANALVGDVTVANTSNPARPRIVRARLDLPFDVESVAMVGRTAYAYGDADARVAVVSATRGRLQRVRNIAPGNEGGPDLIASGDGRLLFATHSQQPPDRVVSVVRRSDLTSVQAFQGTSFPRGLATATTGPAAGDFFVTAGLGLSEPKGFFPFSRTP
ncbi:hypothetical protein GCM10009737_29830 [Nocardioides lentus]|uniref:YncE family protein n=1 Tax=Nocardioides lentus TaxID=338077 RepID=A0ABN2PND4_9ACTN